MNRRKVYSEENRKLSVLLRRSLAKGALAVVFAAFGHGGVSAEVRATDEGATAAASAAVAASVQSSYAGVVRRVSPTVVTIRAERRARTARQFPFMDDPFFREFFGDRLPRGQEIPRSERQRGVGSGVIVRPDGYILTNHHVVDGAEEIVVEMNDRRTFTAKLIGSDPPSDLAVLKIEAQNLPVLSLGDSEKVEVGDIVLAVGNPLGVGQTVTQGIISAKGRQTGLGDGSFEDFLQTDAAINRGNSGGALVNTAGELVGINSQILSPSGGNIGIGFAIPSNMARDVMNQLLTTGRVRRGMIGVGIQPVTPDIAASLGLERARGALVSEVRAGGPAERAGVRRGDVVVAFNGAAVEDSNSFRNMVAGTRPGSDVTLTVWRDGREQQLRATLAELDVESARAGREEGAPEGAATPGGRLGVAVEPLTPESTARFNLPRDARGLVVVNVDPESPAAEAGVRRGDVIQEVNRLPVNTREDLSRALAKTGERPALILLVREGRAIFVTVRLR